jgi:uncharacterized protein (TIGR02284 family)
MRSPRNEPIMTKLLQQGRSSSALAAKLNRLIVADQDESRTLRTAARIVGGTERRQRLLHQALRRAVFQRDLGAAVVAMGGVPAKAGSLRAMLSGLASGLRRFLAGPHQGDAYASCARACEKTSNAYARVLHSNLPAGVRFGLERELAELEWDCNELRRLRFGARPAASPLVTTAASGVVPRPPSSSESNDELALETWTDEGGAVAFASGR